jgi:hypothetical protein
MISVVLLTFLTDESLDRVPGPAALVAVAEMGSLVVVVVQPGVEVGLEHLDALVELLVHRRAEELAEHGAVEALDEAVGLGRADPGRAVLDLVERQVELPSGRFGSRGTSIIGKFLKSQRDYAALSGEV